VGGASPHANCEYPDGSWPMNISNPSTPYCLADLNKVRNDGVVGVWGGGRGGMQLASGCTRLLLSACRLLSLCVCISGEKELNRSLHVYGRLLYL